MTLPPHMQDPDVRKDMETFLTTTVPEVRLHTPRRPPSPAVLRRSEEQLSQGPLVSQCSADVAAQRYAPPPPPPPPDQETEWLPAALRRRAPKPHGSTPMRYPFPFLSPRPALRLPPNFVQQSSTVLVGSLKVKLHAPMFGCCAVTSSSSSFFTRASQLPSLKCIPVGLSTHAASAAP